MDISQKELVSKLLEASNIISKSESVYKSKAAYLHLSQEYIELEAQKRGISFTEMIDILKKELN